MAEQHQEDLTLLEHLHDFYWDKVRETLTTTTESTVRIMNLGQFERKHWCVEARHKKAKAFVEKVEGSSRRINKEPVLKEILQLEAMMAFRDEEVTRKRMKKTHTQNEYHPNLEEPRSDH